MDRRRKATWTGGGRILRAGPLHGDLRGHAVVVGLLHAAAGAAVPALVEDQGAYSTPEVQSVRRGVSRAVEASKNA